MEVLQEKLAEGNVYARMFLTCAEIEEAGSPQQAISATVERFAGERELGQLLFPRVLTMDWDNDMNLSFTLEAAVKPAVELEDYRGMEVYVPAGEERESVIQEAVVKKLRACIPSVLLDRKMEVLLMQVKAEIADKSRYTTLSDMYAMLRDGDEALGTGRAEEELWQAARELAEEYLGQRGAESTPEDLIAALADILVPQGADDEQIEKLDACVSRRSQQRGMDSAEELVNQCFACYLRAEEVDEEEMMEGLRATAEEQVRIELLLDTVAERENIEVTREETEQALMSIGEMYGLDPTSVLEMVNQDSLLFQLRRDKARTYLATQVKVV